MLLETIALYKSNESERSFGGECLLLYLSVTSPPLTT